jgi:hypothetical protein
MARASWIDDDSNPALDAHVAQLEHYSAALADGKIDAAELEQQEQNLVAAMRAVEPNLDDAMHAKVTKLLAELSAYTVMQVLHDLARAKVERAINKR